MKWSEEDQCGPGALMPLGSSGAHLRRLLCSTCCSSSPNLYSIEDGGKQEYFAVAPAVDLFSDLTLTAGLWGEY